MSPITITLEVVRPSKKHLCEAALLRRGQELSRQIQVVQQRIEALEKGRRCKRAPAADGAKTAIQGSATS